MKRIRYTTLMLLALFCIIPVLSVQMIHHLTIVKTLSQMGDGSYGDFYSLIFLDNNGAAVDSFIDAMEENKAKYAICLSEDIDENTVIQHLYFNKTYADFLMEEGRFFRASDLKDKNNAAVVGKNKKNDIYRKNGNSYIMVQGVECSVLGIIGYEKDTLLDNYIFVNYFSDIEKNGHMYIVDYFDKVDASAMTEECLEVLQAEGFEGEILSIGESYSNSIMPQVYSARWFIGLLACCFLNLLLITEQWLNGQRREVSILRLVGDSLNNIVKRIMVKYSVLYLASVVAGLLYCKAVHLAYFKYLLKGYVLYIPFFLVLYLWTFRMFAKDSISEEIK